MSIFDSEVLRDAVKTKWESCDFEDVIHQGFGRNAPINKFVISVKDFNDNMFTSILRYFSVDVESWFYDGDDGYEIDFEDIEDDFVEVRGVEKITIDWVEV